MEQERIQDLAIAKASTGLSGEDLAEYDRWWPVASEEERALFLETVDLLAMVSLSGEAGVSPSPSVKARIMERIGGEGEQTQKSETSATIWRDGVEGEVGESGPDQDEKSLAAEVPGYRFLLDGEGEWKELPNRGTRIKELSCSKASRTATFILEMDPGSRLLSHHHRGAEGAFVLHGDLQMRGKVLRAGDHMRAEAGTKHEDLYSEMGCRALIITALENYPRRSIRAFDALSPRLEEGD